MNALIVLLLVVLWVSILAPGARRGRRARSPRSSVDAFERSMGVLAQAGRSGRAVLVVGGVGPLDEAAARRRRTLARRTLLLQVLLAAVAGSGVLAVAVGGVFPAVLAGALLALGGYVGLLVHLRLAAERTRRTVLPLPVGSMPDPEDGAPAAGAVEPVLEGAEVPVAAAGGGA